MTQGLQRSAALFAVFAVVALAVYWPALHGDFVSDDIGYVAGNPYVHALTLDNLGAILDPLGPAASHTANYAPLHLLGHAGAWALFGPDTTGHHVLNVVLHAVVSVLLVALLVRSGVWPAAACFGGAVFLVHPANVEAVAWIFQLKTILALGLAIGAALAEPERPLLALVLFAAALLAKIAAASVLGLVVLLAWLDLPRGSRPRATRLAWLGAWVLVLGLALVPELFAFERLGHAPIGAPLGLVERIRETGALAGRYALMALTSLGVSAFHQPDRVASWANPWWLAGAAIALAVAARSLVALRRGRAEAAWWGFAVAGFVPVSQVLPFLYPMADRYLYFVLPGLLGAGLLAATPALERLRAAWDAGSGPARALAAGLCLVVLVPLGAHATARAAIWKSELGIALDAARHYPDGIPAQLLRAQGAARRGEVEETVRALRRATQRGFDRFMDLERSPAFEAVRDDPRFRALVAEVAQVWIDRVEPRGEPTPMELSMLGQAYGARGDWERAVELLERALAAAGPNAQQVRAELSRAKIRALKQRRGDADGSP